MVADGVHVLLGVSLVVAVLRTRRAEPYLVAILAASVPDLDKYLFTPFVYAGYLSGPLWTHRGITHSLLALLLFVGAAYRVGHWRAAVLGYGSHLVADYLTGGIRLFAPFTVRLYGLYYDWMLGNVVAGSFAVVVTLVGLAAMLRLDGDADANATTDTGTGAVAAADDPFGRFSRWWFR